MPAKIRLLIIDPQSDFCDGLANGALPVPGAWNDMVRLGAFVDRVGSRLDDIIVTLDSHHPFDVAHSTFWVNSRGEHPAPFTMITVSDVESGVWTPRKPNLRQRMLDYVRKLKLDGKYVLMIWTTHCLIGSPGAAVQPDLFAALCRWAEREPAVVTYVTKGSNPFTEHYSAISAEVPDPSDPSTQLNGDLIKTLQDSDVILIAGEALSHCLKSTVQDIADNIGEAHIKKFVLLEDCTSSIPAAPGTPDFPAIAQAWIADMKLRGMKVSNSVDYLART